MRARLAWFLGGAGVAGAVALRALLARRPGTLAEPPSVGEGVADRRADELRRRLEESRAVVAEREEFEAGETPVDRADPGDDPDARRRRVHDAGRAAAERMRGEP